MKAFERHYTDFKELVNEIDWEDTTSINVSTKRKKLEIVKRNICLITSHQMKRR